MTFPRGIESELPAGSAGRRLASDGYIAIGSIESDARKRPTPPLHSSECHSIGAWCSRRLVNSSRNAAAYCLADRPETCLTDRPETNLCGIPLELCPDIFVKPKCFRPSDAQVPLINSAPAEVRLREG